eukprot:scaffold19468_cov45-Phaeocystis_antarctica.AAC.4
MAIHTYYGTRTIRYYGHIYLYYGRCVHCVRCYDQYIPTTTTTTTTTAQVRARGGRPLRRRDAAAAAAPRRAALLARG